MIQREEKISQYRSLEPGNFPILVNLVLEQKLPDEVNEYNVGLVLTLRNRRRANNDRLIVSFSRVRNFYLDPGNMEISFSSLTISPVNNGWEGVNFRVRNDEQDVALSFLCYDFESRVSSVAD